MKKVEKAENLSVEIGTCTYIENNIFKKLQIHKGRLQKKNGKMSDIVHLLSPPYPPDLKNDNLNNDKLVFT